MTKSVIYLFNFKVNFIVNQEQYINMVELYQIWLFIISSNNDATKFYLYFTASRQRIFIHL